MSFTPKCAFQRRIPATEYKVDANLTGKYQVSSADADCDAGQLCVLGAKLPVEGMPSGTYNENAYYMTAATSSATANDLIVACDTHETQLLSSPNGNKYYVGTETLHLGVPAGRYGNFQIVYFNENRHYRFGEGNVTINTTNDAYLTINNGKLTSQTAKPTTAGTLYFEIVGTGNYTEGTQQGDGYYDVVAHAVVA